MPTDQSNRFTALREDDEEEEAAETMTDGWDEELSVSSDHSEMEKSLSSTNHKVFTRRSKDAHSYPGVTTSLVSAAASIGFPYSKLTKLRNPISLGRGGGLSKVSYTQEVPGGLPFNTGRDSDIPVRKSKSKSKVDDTGNKLIRTMQQPQPQDDSQDDIEIIEAKPIAKEVGRPMSSNGSNSSIKNKTTESALIDDIPTESTDLTNPSSPPDLNIDTQVSSNTRTTTNTLPTSLSDQPTFSRITTNPSTSKLTFFTYRAQLTFGLSQACREVNVASLFTQWLEKSFSLVENLKKANKSLHHTKLQMIHPSSINTITITGY
jgi:hypothetical protein